MNSKVQKCEYCGNALEDKVNYEDTACCMKRVVERTKKVLREQSEKETEARNILTLYGVKFSGYTVTITEVADLIKRLA